MRIEKPLYRSVNTRTHGVRHGSGIKSRDERGTKRDATKAGKGSMHSGQRHGRDYTPLFKFLLSKVGQPYSDVHKAAVARLDQVTPISWIVAEGEADRQPYVRCGESSYYSGLFVDQDGLLQKVDPDLDETSLRPFCSCCTHTFNGKRFTRTFEGN